MDGGGQVRGDGCGGGGGGGEFDGEEVGGGGGEAEGAEGLGDLGLHHGIFLALGDVRFC